MPFRALRRTACKRWELDPSALIIAAMEKLGLAWNVMRISPSARLNVPPDMNIDLAAIKWAD